MVLKPCENHLSGLPVAPSADRHTANRDNSTLSLDGAIESHGISLIGRGSCGKTENETRVRFLDTEKGAYPMDSCRQSSSIDNVDEYNILICLETNRP